MTKLFKYKICVIFVESWDFLRARAVFVLLINFVSMRPSYIEQNFRTVVRKFTNLENRTRFWEHAQIVDIELIREFFKFTQLIEPRWIEKNCQIQFVANKTLRSRLKLLKKEITNIFFRFQFWTFFWFSHFLFFLIFFFFI